MLEATTFPTRPVGQRSTHLVDATMFWSATGGGVRRYLLIKQAWLKRQGGWHHTIVAPGASGNGTAECPGFPLPLSGGYRLPIRRELGAAIIERLAPDIIEAGDPYRLAWSALDAAQRLGVPAVAFCHTNLAAMAARLAGSQGARARLAHRLAGAYLRRTYRHFDLVLAPSESMVAELENLGIGRVECQPLGVDSALFHPSRRDSSWRASLGLPADARLLLYAGRFAPEKNLPVLVEAVERLGPPYVLLAIGQGPTPPQGRQVRVLPHEPRDTELARIYSSVDGFVHAGDQETFGLAALEAMACGTPLVVRAAAGLKELVAGNAGIAVDSAAPAVWAEAIAELFTGGCKTRIDLARARAESLDWQCVLPALLGRYKRLLAGRPVDACRQQTVGISPVRP